MASGIKKRSGSGISPLMGLASFFETARKRTGTITLPPDTRATIKRYRAQESNHHEMDVDAIVRAIEGSDLCSRLDPEGLLILCSVFIHSQLCLAQQRGLFLISEVLHETQSDSVAIIAMKHSKKDFVGARASNALINGFLNREVPEQNRRWMGVLALELLQNSQETTVILSSDINKLRALSDVIRHGRCQILKLVAGSIIRIMLNEGVLPRDLWPAVTDQELYANFPKGTYHDLQWITEFEGFVDELLLENVLIQDRSDMLFAHAVLIGNVRYEPEGESAILVTISEDVNIVVTASATEPARYVDIPMKSVQGVTLDQILSTQSQTPMYGLLITLRNEPYNCYYVNAATGNDQTIALAFMSENDAKTLKRIIQGKLPTNRKSMEVREPEGEMDVSMPLSDDELGDAPLSNSQDLRETARQATSFVARNLPNGVSQRQQVDGSDASQWAETIPSCGVEGINVSVDTHSVLRNGPPTAQHEREVRPPQEEDVGFDSSYDISPKAASQNKSSVTGRRNFTQSLQNLIGATVDSDTTAAVANNIATKLSRRLQNGEGEVEVNDAEPVSTSVGTIIAEEKSTNRKEKVTREKAPAKDRGKTHEAPKPPKKGGVGKGKKKALPDQLESVREEQAPLKSTDQRNGLIASSKRTSKSSGQNPNSLSEEAPKQNLNPLPNGSAKHTKPTEKVNADEESIWDEALIPSDQDSVKQSERTVAVKKARKQPAKAAKAKKGEQIQGHLKKAKSQPKKAPGESKKAQTKLLAKPAIKQKLSPVALSQPKLRREAARIANKRIQHVDESDEIVDDDTETVTKPNTISSAAAATQFHLLNMTDKTRKQPIRRGDENDTSLRAEKQRRKLAEDASVQRHPERALPSTKMQPARRPVSDSYEDVTSPENVELVSEPHSEKPPGVALLATSDHPTADKADRQVQVVPTDAIPDDDVAHSYHHSNASEQAFVPDSVPNMQVALLKGDEEGVMDAQAKGQYDLERTTMVGEMVDSHFQEALLYASDGLTFIGDEANPQDEIKIAPLAKEEAQPRLPVVGKGKEVRKIEQDTIFSTYTPQLPKEKGAENKAERSSEAAVTLMPKQIELRNGSKTPQFPQQRSELVKDDPYTINKPKLPGRTHVTPKVSRLKTLNPNPAVQQPHRTVNADNPIPPRQVQGSKSIATLETHANRSRREIVPPNVLAMISTSVSHQQDDTPLLEAVRRVPMISFGASGPRNQGMVSTEKSRQPKLSNAMQGHAVEEAIAHGNPTPKRRFAPYRDDPASWEHDQPAKKRKQNVETPLSRHKHVPQMLAEASPEKPQPEARRRSSQSTRVMENGSPMPLLHTRNDIPAGSEIHARYYEVSDAFRRAHLEDDDDDPIVIQDALNEPILSLPRNVSKLEIIDMRHGTFPSNRKQVPSSPHAPSTFGTVPVHHVYDDGAIVNAATKEPLVPTQPQDPFVGASQMSSGPFMKALRKSSEMEAGRQSDQANEQKTSAGFSLKKRSHALAEDLDKTLVDSPPRPKKRKMLHPISSNISSSSPSSSEEVSGSSESPSQESDGETSANWRTAYEPHQSNMLEVLTHISHRLVRHLIDKETAVKDIVKDYATGGNNLINGYEKERQKEIDTRNEKVEHLRHDLSSALKKAQIDQNKTRKAMSKRPTKDIKAEWKDQQQNLMVTTRAALADCETL